MIAFRYFQAPRSEMSSFAEGPVTCAFCGVLGDGFDLDSAICAAMTDEERESKHGCPACLTAGRFAFEHNTDIGTLDENGLRKVYANHRDAPTDVRSDALETLLHTPDVLRWQYEPWLTHCSDFMAYIGMWEPSDFVRHAPDGDGRALFMRMTREEDLRHVWDECADGKAAPSDDWHLTYYVYRCLRCGELAGNWDCD